MIIMDNDPILLTKPPVYDFSKGDSKDLEKMMLEALKASNAISLCAQQLGVIAPIIAIKGTPSKVYFNPRIVFSSPELALATEVCRSYPGLSIKVTRPFKIRVRYQNSDGVTITEALEGAEARLFQHEMDHINGKCWFDSANFLNRNKAIKDWKQIKRKIKKENSKDV